MASDRFKESFTQCWIGCCSRSCPTGKTPEEVELASRSKKIDQQLKTDQRKMQQEVKLLLLGAGESGKSTFIKQMKIIHGVVFEPEQIKEFRKIIYQNMIKGMRVLVDANRKLNIPLHNPANILAGDQVMLLLLFLSLFYSFCKLAVFELRGQPCRVRGSSIVATVIKSKKYGIAFAMARFCLFKLLNFCNFQGILCSILYRPSRRKLFKKSLAKSFAG